MNCRSVILATVFLFVSSVSFAQATRTWVSGVGDDVNPCSRTAPCKTFAGAISKTASGGEIDVLDPGGFGALTITKPLTVDGNNVGSILASAGSSGIIVNMTSTAGVGNVIIRNLTINGIGSGVTGVRIIASAARSVRIENVKIYGMTSNGVFINPTAPNTSNVTINNSSIMNNSPKGIDVAGTGGVGLASLELRDSTVANCGTGVHVETGNKAVVANSLLTSNATWGLVADGSGSTASIYGSVISFNGTGVQSGQPGFGGAIVSLSKNQFVGNGTALVNSSSTLNSHQDNAIDGNLGFVPTGIGQQ